MKRIFVVDWVLLASFVTIAISGIVMHILHDHYGHCFCNRSPIMNLWDTMHIVAAVVFTLATLLHVWQHLAWYKQIFKSGIGSRSKVSLLLTLVVVVMIVTGGVLWFGPCNNHLGLWHMWIGIAMAVAVAYHVIKRWKVLVKSLK